MKNTLPVVLLLWSVAWGPIPEPKLPDARPASSHPLTVVVCEEGPGDGCRALKKISQATVIIDDRYAGRTNEDGSLTTMVQRGPRALNIAAVGYAAVELRVDVRSDAHFDVELKPAPPLLSRIRAEDRFFVNDATHR
ncbi:MAG TPA: PEGA domain-containing protein [Vicinamibacterales bacterium]|jgi:hypothetical protein|nr:PEGA domain-containing protein [Vicinamibacterales bacterium]